MSWTEIPGKLYLYIERILASIPWSSSISAQVIFKKQTYDVEVFQAKPNEFRFLRKLVIPFTIKENEDKTIKSKKLVIKLTLMNEKGQRKTISSFVTGLTEKYQPAIMEIEAYEMRSKLEDPPTIILSYGVYPESREEPDQFTRFKVPRVKDAPIDIPKTPSKILTVVPVSPVFEQDEDDFDKDLTEQILELGSSNVEPVLRHFVDIASQPPGKPGRDLAKAGPLSSNGFSMLNDFCSTSTQPQTANLFFASALELDKAFSNGQTQNLVRAALERAVELVVPSIVGFVKDSINGKPRVDQYKEEMKKYQSESYMQTIWNEALEEADCKLASLMITDGWLNTVGLSVNANTALSDFEAKTHTYFKRFHEALLCSQAGSSILEDPQTVKELAPLVDANFAYWLLAGTKPDFILPQGYDFAQLDRFAQVNNVDFKAEKNTFLFTR